jgi:hypothetical protein
MLRALREPGSHWGHMQRQKPLETAVCGPLSRGRASLLNGPLNGATMAVVVKRLEAGKQDRSQQRGHGGPVFSRGSHPHSRNEVDK